MNRLSYIPPDTRTLDDYIAANEMISMSQPDCKQFLAVEVQKEMATIWAEVLRVEKLCKDFQERNRIAWVERVDREIADNEAVRLTNRQLISVSSSESICHKLRYLCL